MSSSSSRKDNRSRGSSRIEIRGGSSKSRTDNKRGSRNSSSNNSSRGRKNGSKGA